VLAHAAKHRTPKEFSTAFSGRMQQGAVPSAAAGGMARTIDRLDYLRVFVNQLRKKISPCQ
jgi:hypothetical protein